VKAVTCLPHTYLSCRAVNHRVLLVARGRLDLEASVIAARADEATSVSISRYAICRAPRDKPRAQRENTRRRARGNCTVALGESDTGE